MKKPQTQQSSESTAISYKDAGVDIEAGDSLVQRIRPMVKRTLRDGVLSGLGGFGALFEMPKRYQEPILVSGTDGVGTKLKLAFEWNMHSSIGVDLVAMSVNDILTQGAEPLFFLDYFSCGKLNVDNAAEVINGIANGCEQAGCALVGGETAEMPGMYPPGEYDLAGFAVGVVEKSKIMDGSTIQAQDVVLGISSSGVHSNGYSLVRKLIERAGADLPQTLDGQSFRDAVMAPTQIYVRPILAALNRFQIHGLAHITGGGLSGNIPRILPAGRSLVLHSEAWPQSELFAWLQNSSGLDTEQMHATFNCGIGLALVVSPQDSQSIADWMQDQGLTCHTIAHIE